MEFFGYGQITKGFFELISIFFSIDPSSCGIVQGVPPIGSCRRSREKSVDPALLWL
jgi:hypothetical protein